VWHTPLLTDVSIAIADCNAMLPLKESRLCSASIVGVVAIIDDCVILILNPQHRRKKDDIYPD
jgi:hypothetical protein